MGQQGSVDTFADPIDTERFQHGLPNPSCAWSSWPERAIDSKWTPRLWTSNDQSVLLEKLIREGSARLTSVSRRGCNVSR
ncbi:hypothetical protein GCM10009789_12600 [Kribbella sancticallisti]|uniref:Uncharacterized protein n=1 Tax=Kribbella sancticallisti TaxID=460087 RepID=A0ABN2CP00_9ACTN